MEPKTTTIEVETFTSDTVRPPCHGPGAAGHPAPARQEDRRDADDRWRGAGHDVRRPGAGESAGTGVPIPGK
jgi:hypothetical protein